MSDPFWITKSGLLFLYQEMLAVYGGKAGIRDEGLLESALWRARNVYFYQGVSDPSRLAAAYGFGIARNHPFFDGNKRAAFLAIGLFLNKNGFRLTASTDEATRTITAVADGSFNEEELASWIERYTKRL